MAAADRPSPLIGGNEGYLTDIQVRAEILEGAKEQLDGAVIRARQADVSWERIATALGVKRQSAMERFGKLVG